MAPLTRQNVAHLLLASALAGTLATTAIWAILPGYRHAPLVAVLLPGIKVAALFGGIFLGARLAIHWAEARHGLAYAVAGALGFGAAVLLGPGAGILPIAEARGLAPALWSALALLGASLGLLGGDRATPDNAGRPATSPAPRRHRGVLSKSATCGFGGWPEAENQPDIASIVTRDYDAAQPVQVRSCLISALMASLAGGLAAYVMARYTTTLYTAALHTALAEPPAAHALLEYFSDHIARMLPRFEKASVLITAYATLGVIALPLPVFITHKLLQGRGFSSHLVYGAAGALFTMVVGAMTQVMLHTTMLAYVLPMALAMLLYRMIAGLEPAEPAAKPEAIDRRVLMKPGPAGRGMGQALHTPGR